MPIACTVKRTTSLALPSPYEVEVPHSSVASAGSLVEKEIVALVCVVDALTPEITGATTSTVANAHVLVPEKPAKLFPD